MSCNKILQQICDELAEDINSDLCENLRQHLSVCPHCSRQLSSMRAVVQLYRCLEEKEVPPAIHHRLLELFHVADRKV